MLVAAATNLAYGNTVHNYHTLTLRCTLFTRPSFGALKDLRAFTPPGVPMLATTATVTVRMREYIIEKLDMGGCFIVSESPNKPNICYEVTRKKTIEEDFECIIRDVAASAIFMCLEAQTSTS